MLTNIINVTVVAVVAIIGSKLNKGIRQDVVDGLMKALGLFMLYLGITGLDTGANPIAVLVAVAVGAAIGCFMDWDGAINRAADAVTNKFAGKGDGNNYAEAMVTYFITSCSGAYTIVACFNAGMGDPSMLWTKVVIDLIVGLVWSTSMGIGLGLSAVPMFIYQSALILLSGALSPLMTEPMLAILGCMGGLLTLAIGLNFLNICEFKIANFIPCMIIAPFVTLLF